MDDSATTTRKDSRHRYLTYAILFMVPLTGMGIDLYAPSLPWIVRALHTSPHLVKLTIAAYLIGYSIGPLFAGTLSDVKGRLPTLRSGMCVYLIACLLIILIPSIHMMLWMRAVQGIAASMLSVVFRSMVTDSYDPGPDMRRMGASISLIWAIGPVIAPFIGGYLQHYFGWQANFIFFIGYAALILLLSFILPETNKAKHSWDMKTVLGHYRAIISHRTFWCCVICMGIAYGVIVVFNVIGPFLIQDVLHHTPIFFGYVALIMGLGLLLGNATNRILVERYAVTRIIPFGLYGMIIGSVLLLVLGLSYHSVALYTFTTPVMIVFLMCTLVFPNGLATVMGLFPDKAGAANAVIGVTFSSITTIASIVASFIHSGTQIPMSIVYIVLSLICWAGYYFLMRPTMKHSKT